MEDNEILSSTSEIGGGLVGAEIEITEAQLLKLKVELLEAQLAAIKALKDAAPIVTEAAKNPEVIKETGPLDKWVTGGGTKSHIKNPA